MYNFRAVLTCEGDTLNGAQVDVDVCTGKRILCNIFITIKIRLWRNGLVAAPNASLITYVNQTDSTIFVDYTTTPLSPVANFTVSYKTTTGGTFTNIAGEVSPTKIENLDSCTSYDIKVTPFIYAPDGTSIAGADSTNISIFTGETLFVFIRVFSTQTFDVMLCVQCLRRSRLQISARWPTPPTPPSTSRASATEEKILRSSKQPSSRPLT